VFFLLSEDTFPFEIRFTYLFIDSVYRYAYKYHTRFNKLVGLYDEGLII